MLFPVKSPAFLMLELRSENEVEGHADPGSGLFFQNPQVTNKCIERNSPLLAVIPIRAQRAEGSAVCVGSPDLSRNALTSDDKQHLTVTPPLFTGQ